ncbi:MAG: Glycosyl hydrolase family 109 protein 1 [Verrucomicrobiae bacterium]|nr:Glycosyl hydrolase family 109 protein 1 [Verrucomicrobiae bacterium]
MKNLIRIGVVGLGRGQSFMEGATAATGLKLVAICDQQEARAQAVAKKYGVTTYSDYDKFLEHDMDGVVLANYFHEHTPFAIKALRAGKHVMSETAACSTLAEGVALCREVERTGKIYMFAENYPFTAASLTMERLYKAGKLGEVRYADGEYNHPGPPPAKRPPLTNLHWRNRIPSTYYCTHALAPLMQITDTWPVSVNGFSIVSPRHPNSVRRGDTGSVIICRMDNGAVFRLFGLCMGGHSIWYRLHGTRGILETLRGPGYFGPNGVRVAIDEWNCRTGEKAEEVVMPQFPKWAKGAEAAGHGGGDFFTNYLFSQAIRTGQQPFLDVYRGVAMSVVGILAWKSALQNGAPFAMPDFKKEASRRKHAKDTWSPFTGSAPCGTKYP